LRAIHWLPLVALAAAACVDGTTPDCSTPASGCYPSGDDAGQTDASDASSDVNSPSDGGGDASNDASSD